MFDYFPCFYYSKFNSLNETEVARARNRRLKESHIWSIIRQSFIYISFLIDFNNKSILAVVRK
jgi:hypothetical protein